MSGIHTSVVTDAHVYTREKSPWIIDSPEEGGRLIHYISGGGMNTFGRTIAQELARAKHRRFYALAAAFGILWLVFLFI